MLCVNRTSNVFADKKTKRKTDKKPSKQGNGYPLQIQTSFVVCRNQMLMISPKTL